MADCINKYNGFTLIELVLIIVILGIISTIAMKSMQPAVEQTRLEATTQEMDMLVQAIIGDENQVQDGIRMDFGYVGDVGSLPANLDALATNPGYSTWDGPYIQNDFSEDTEDYKRDGWNELYTYIGGVTITSNGGGSTITKQLARNVSDLTSNTVTGNIYDGLGAVPGANSSDITITIYYPDGSGGLTSSSINPSASGAFSFSNSIPVGNHLIRAVYSTTNDTTAKYLSITPGANTYRELRFPGAVWSGGAIFENEQTLKYVDVSPARPDSNPDRYFHYLTSFFKCDNINFTAPQVI